MAPKALTNFNIPQTLLNFTYVNMARTQARLMREKTLLAHPDKTGYIILGSNEKTEAVINCKRWNNQGSIYRGQGNNRIISNASPGGLHGGLGTLGARAAAQPDLGGRVLAWGDPGYSGTLQLHNKTFSGTLYWMYQNHI